MKTRLAVTIVSVVAFTSLTMAQGEISGCLLTPGGILYNVRVGDTPSAPCRPQDTTMMWNVSGPSVFEFVGFSGTTHDGAEGALTFNGACHATFPGSRMCTSEEILETTPPPSGISGDFAWVRSVLVSHQLLGWALDISGEIGGLSGSDAGVLSCNGWLVNQGGFNGLTTQGSTGRFAGQPCDTARPVACCAPK